MLLFCRRFNYLSFQENEKLFSPDRENEMAKLKSILGSILISFRGICYEKDLKKSYKDRYGQNINLVLEKLDTSLLNFLRFNCREFCTIFRPPNKLDCEYRIHPTVRYSTPIVEAKAATDKKKGRKSTAPSLKYSKFK